MGAESPKDYTGIPPEAGPRQLDMDHHHTCVHVRQGVMHLDGVAVFLADGHLIDLPFLFECEPIPMEWTSLGRGSATM